MKNRPPRHPVVRALQTTAPAGSLLAICLGMMALAAVVGMLQ